MSEQPKDLQKREEKKETLTQKAAFDTVTKTISTFIVEHRRAIYSVISIIVTWTWSYFLNMPAYLYAPVGLLVVVALVLIWHFTSLRPTNKLQAIEIESLKAKITELEQTIETRPTKVIEKTAKPKRKPNITFVKTDLIAVTFDSFQVKRFLKTDAAYQADAQALTVRFYSQPTTNTSGIIAKATITFTNLDTKAEETIQTGVWLDTYSDDTFISPGEFIESVVAFYDRCIYLCEHEYLDKIGGRKDMSESFRRFSGTRFEINIDFIGKDSFGGIILPPKKFKFRLEIKPKLKFEEIK